MVAVLGSALAVTITAQQNSGSRDMTLLGSNDLQARSAYQPVIQRQGTRYIAYVGHHAGSMPNVLTGRFEDNGTSIVDVTNPRQPKYLAHIPGGGEEQGPGQAQMVRVCSGSDLPKADKSKVKAVGRFLQSDDKVLVCTHATFRFSVEEYGITAFNNRLIAVDEFHHVSSNPENVLGSQLTQLIAGRHRR